MVPHCTMSDAPPIVPLFTSRYMPIADAESIAIQCSMFAPFIGLVGCTSIVQRKRAGAHQVSKTTKGGGVGVFHASIEKNFADFEMATDGNSGCHLLPER